MFNKKLFISLFVFSLLMVFTSIIKTQTRVTEKNINLYKKKISKIKNDIHESKLDFYYLSSPSSLVKKIEDYLVDRVGWLRQSKFLQERRPHFEVTELKNKKDHVLRRYGSHLHETFPLFFNMFDNT